MYEKKPSIATLKIGLMLSWWERVKVCCGVPLAVRLTIRTPRYMDKAQVEARVLVGKEAA